MVHALPSYQQILLRLFLGYIFTCNIIEKKSNIGKNIRKIFTIIDKLQWTYLVSNEMNNGSRAVAAGVAAFTGFQ